MKAILVATLATFLVAFASANPRIECPVVDGEYVTLLPNPLDCTTYYSCNRGWPILMKCYGGLEFNPEKKVCDYPQDAHCVKIVPTSTLSPSPSPTTSQGPVSSQSPSPSPTTSQGPVSSQSPSPSPTTSQGPVSSQSPATTRLPWSWTWSWRWPRSIISAPSPDELKSKSSTIPPGSTTGSPNPTKPPRLTTSPRPSETPSPTPDPTPSPTPDPTPSPTPDPPRPTESPRPSEPPQSSESDSMESPELPELELRLLPIWRPLPIIPPRPMWPPHRPTIRPRPPITIFPPRHPTPPRPPTIRPRLPRLPTTTTEKA